MDTMKSKTEKKREGDPNTLPEASKKAKTSATQLFQTNAKWSASSSGLGKTATATTAQMDSDTRTATSASSSSSSVPTPTSSAPKPPVARKGAFGFSAQHTATEHTKKTPQKPVSRKSVEPAPSTPSAPMLPLPTVSATLPARFIAEGVSIDQALANVVGEHQKSVASDKPLIIIDSANVSHEHGQGVFTTQGLPLAVQYFKNRGFSVVAFLPEHYLSQHYPDPLQDWSPLESLVAEKILIPTPGADYDDLYIVQHARKHNGVIVTRDKYRDVPLLFTDPTERSEVAQWIKRHRIPFKFEGDTFTPLSVPRGFPLDLKRS